MTRIISSPHFDIAPVRLISPDWCLAGVSPNDAPTPFEFRKRAGTSTVAHLCVSEGLDNDARRSIRSFRVGGGRRLNGNVEQLFARANNARVIKCAASELRVARSRHW